MSNNNEHVSDERIRVENAKLEDNNIKLKTQNETLTAENKRLHSSVILHRFLLIAAVVIGGLIWAYLNFSQTKQEQPPEPSQDTEPVQQDYPAQAREILRGLDERFVSAGAIESIDFVAAEKDISRSWNGRSIFKSYGQSSGIIIPSELANGLRSPLERPSAEVARDGYTFQADISGSFNPTSIIRDAIHTTEFLKPAQSRSHVTRDKAIEDIASRLSEKSSGYIRFIMRTEIPGVHVMAVLRLNPYDPNPQRFIATEKGNIFVDDNGEKLREIESNITVSKEKNIAVFNVKSGGLRKDYSLIDCMGKFVGQFVQ